MLTFKRKLLDMAVVTNKHHLLLEVLGWSGTECDLEYNSETIQPSSWPRSRASDCDIWRSGYWGLNSTLSSLTYRFMMLMVHVLNVRPLQFRLINSFINYWALVTSSVVTAPASSLNMAGFSSNGSAKTDPGSSRVHYDTE